MRCAACGLDDVRQMGNGAEELLLWEGGASWPCAAESTDELRVLSCRLMAPRWGAWPA